MGLCYYFLNDFQELKDDCFYGGYVVFCKDIVGELGGNIILKGVEGVLELYKIYGLSGD